MTVGEPDCIVCYRGIVYRAWEEQLHATVTWRRENVSWRRLIHQQANELSRWLDTSEEPLRFWHLDDDAELLPAATPANPASDDARTA